MRKSKTTVNSVANLAARLWGIVSTYIFIPLYIQYLGKTTYGLVSFFATLQSALTLLGMGLSSTLRREFAVGDEEYETRKGKYLILRSVENIYFIIALVIILICWIGSDFISTRWLNIEELDPQVVSLTITLMGVSIGLQLISNLWFGCILGMGRQVYANICSVIWAIAKSVGSLAISIIWQNVVLFYTWHIITDVIYMIVLRVSINKYLNVQEKWNIRDFRNIERIWKYALGLFGISIVALITKQFDKFLISGFLTLTELGAYNLATTLGNLAIIFASALSITALTDFTRLYSQDKSKELGVLYHSFSNVVSFVVIAMGTFIAAFSYEIIVFWTHNAEYAEIMKNVAPLVVFAITLIGLQEIPYSLALAHGNTKTNMMTGIVSLPFIVGFTYLFISKWGLIGAGWAYFITMLGQTLIYLLLIYRKYMKDEMLLLLLKNFICPFVICIVLAIGAKTVLYKVTSNNSIIVIGAIAAGAVSLVILFLIFDRYSLKRIINRRRA